MPHPTTSLTASQFSTCLYMQKQAVKRRLVRKGLGWAAPRAKRLIPKVIRHSRATAGPRRAVGHMAQDYGGVASWLGRKGVNSSNHRMARLGERLRDVGYDAQNWGTFQRDIIGNEMIRPSSLKNPLSWGRGLARNWTGGLLTFAAPAPVTSAYFGPTWLNAAYAANSLRGGLGQPKTKAPAKPPAPAGGLYGPHGPGLHNPYLAQNAHKGYRR